MKDWKKVWEWLEELNWEDEDETVEEKKEREKVKAFSEYYFGTPDSWGWHITDKP
jgi:hypothetical protein